MQLTKRAFSFDMSFPIESLNVEVGWAHEITLQVIKPVGGLSNWVGTYTWKRDALAEDFQPGGLNNSAMVQILTNEVEHSSEKHRTRVVFGRKPIFEANTKSKGGKIMKTSKAYAFSHEIMTELEALEHRIKEADTVTVQMRQSEGTWVTLFSWKVTYDGAHYKNWEGESTSRGMAGMLKGMAEQLQQDGSDMRVIFETEPKEERKWYLVQINRHNPVSRLRLTEDEANDITRGPDGWYREDDNQND
ncbi:hypothetical protein D1872_181400 [compost metagenome]